MSIGQGVQMLASGGEKRAAQADQRVDPGFQPAQRHLVPDVAAFADWLSCRVHHAIDAADAADRRIVEALDDVPHAGAVEHGRDVGEHQDLSRHGRDGEALGVLLAAALRRANQPHPGRCVLADDLVGAVGRMV